MHIEDHLKDVNPNYEYTDDEISKILTNRAEFLLRENNKIFGKQIVIAQPLHTNKDGKLKRFLLDEKEKTKERKVLLPCNISGEWIGLLIDFVNKNQEIFIDYLDSAPLGDAILGKKQISTAIPECQLQIVKCWQRKNTSSSQNAAVYMIENLLNAARIDSTPAQVSPKLMRAWHLESLEIFNPEFYLNFKNAQAKYRPITIHSDSAKAMPVDKATDDLFKTLNELDTYIDHFFTANETISKVFPKEDKELYTTVCDDSGKLRLRLVDTAKNRNLVRFKSVKGMTEDFKGFAIDYAPSGIGTAVGSGISVGIGIAESITEVAALGAGRLLLCVTPWTIAATAIFAVASVWSAYEARRFAQKIQQAAELTDTLNKAELIEAREILLAELGEIKNGKNPALRWLGSWSTPSDQLNFAKLLLVHIFQLLGDKEYDAYNEYNSIYERTNNDYIKCMCLVAQIAILKPHAAWLAPLKVGKKSEPNSNMYVIKQKAKILNVHQNFVQQYFVKVLQAYKSVFTIVQNQEYLKDCGDFAKTRLILDKLLRFRDLDCLHYMEKSGKNNYGDFAELTMIFSQAIANIVYELHCKANNSDYENVDIERKKYSDKAVAKMRDCEYIINELKATCSEAKDQYSSEAKIIECIQSYTLTYYKQHNELSDNLNNTSQNVLLHQWHQKSQPLSNNQIKAVVSNMKENGEEFLDEREQESLIEHYKIRHGFR